jgi:hypothetical protein
VAGNGCVLALSDHYLEKVRELQEEIRENEIIFWAEFAAGGIEVSHMRI